MGTEADSPVWVCLCVSRASSFENWAPHWSQTKALAPAERKGRRLLISKSDIPLRGGTLGPNPAGGAGAGGGHL